jgi:phenylalanyl-tRNA synthetase alpha chain
MAELRENEQKTLLALQKLNGRARVTQIMETSGLAHAAVMRAALTLAEEKLVTLHEQKQKVIELNKEGKLWAERGWLPERGTLETTYEKGGEILISDISHEVDIPPDAIPLVSGWLTRKHWAVINREKGTITVTQKERPPLGNDERLLTLLAEKSTVLFEELDRSLQRAAITLKRRKLLEMKERTLQKLELTKNGWRLIQKGLKIVEEVSQLTPELIITRKWQRVKLRKFNVTAPGPITYPGKIHPVQQIIQQIREIFLEMGFTEIRGPIVQTTFWNFDALFQPQDHPAREMMDTFYLSEPKTGKLPRRKIVDTVAKTHENGWKTGSRGWQYSWSRDEAKKLIMRTHTTAVTIHHLAEHKKPPVKVFSVDRIYRNEKLDYQHLAELHQIEGIVLDKNVTLRDLIGTLTEFYNKLGLRKVQFWPSYFPYTEPSAQSTVYVPKLKIWMELCGMGMFRPEVLKPLGIRYPVLAWGGGLERLIMVMLDVDDIRFLYKNDLGWIRRTPVCRQ